MPKPKPIDQDAQSLSVAVSSLIKGFGRGGLSYFAGKIGASPSMLRKRLRSKSGGFDAMTMRTIALLMELKSANHETVAVKSSKEVGNFVIEKRGKLTTWRLK